MRFACFLASLLLAVSSIGAERLTVGEPSPVYRVEITAPDAVVSWLVIPAVEVPVIAPDAKRGVLVAPAGSYRVEAELGGGTGWYTTVTLGKPIVPPKPKPKPPTPKPPVVVPVAVTAVSVVYESGDSTPAIGILRQSRKILDATKAAKIPPVHWVDKQEGGPLVAAVAGKQLPVMVLDRAGGKRDLYALPMTEDAFISAMGGK